MVPRAGLDRCGKSRPRRDSIPGPSSPQPVAIKTTLPGPRKGVTTAMKFDSGARRAAFFTIYSDTGDEQIAVSLGDDITLFYEDPDTKPASKKTISFGADISDGT